MKKKKKIKMKYSFFWDVMQRILAVSYRRFGKTYRPPLQENLLCLTSRKCQDLINTWVSVRNYSWFWHHHEILTNDVH